MGGLALDDITCRLNVSSMTQVYSVFLPALILYYKIAQKYTVNFHKCACQNVVENAQNAKLLDKVISISLLAGNKYTPDMELGRLCK